MAETALHPNIEKIAAVMATIDGPEKARSVAAEVRRLAAEVPPGAGGREYVEDVLQTLKILTGGS